ncbi:MAG TPA: prepilin-type N-terminal cleavage/methylation domain-containing protein [Geomonas sp.]|nr:prepilin-type N-terminal cleavage/methylation domain-containing protein [Geomonas sp.]
MYQLLRLDQQGLTLIELFLVMAILSALALTAIPFYGNIKDNARNARCAGEVRAIEKVIYTFSIDNGGNFPSGLDQLNLASLKDPWGRNYLYYNIITHGTGGARKDGVADLNTDFDLYSQGADGQSDLDDITADISQDDIVRAGDGGFVGIGNIYMPPSR